MGSLNVYKYGLRLHRLAESISWNRFLGSIEVLKYRLCTFFLYVLVHYFKYTFKTSNIYLVRVTVHCEIILNFVNKYIRDLQNSLRPCTVEQYTQIILDTV